MRTNNGDSGILSFEYTPKDITDKLNNSLTTEAKSITGTEYITLKDDEDEYIGRNSLYKGVYVDTVNPYITNIEILLILFHLILHLFLQHLISMSLQF